MLRAATARNEIKFVGQAVKETESLNSYLRIKYAK
jgi:hypothetical protein